MYVLPLVRGPRVIVATAFRELNGLHYVQAQVDIIITRSTARLLEKLHEQHGPIVLYQAKGAFHSTTLDCFPIREFLPSASELMIGQFGGATLYVRKSEIESLRQRQLVVDAGPGSGGPF